MSWIICSFSEIMFDRAEKQHEWNDLVIIHRGLGAMMKGFVTNTNIRFRL
jgi:superfamily I DNA and RNA helicase